MIKKILVRIINFIKNAFHRTLTGEIMTQKTKKQRRNELNLSIQAPLQHQLVGLNPPPVLTGLPQPYNRSVAYKLRWNFLTIFILTQIVVTSSIL